STWLAVGILLLILCGVVLYRTSPTQPSTFKIGAPLLLSGDFVSYGERVKNGINLAVADFKKTHPNTNVEIIFEDTHGEVKQTVSAYQKLVEVDNVDLIIGPML